jgi:predicted membrane protein
VSQQFSVSKTHCLFAMSRFIIFYHIFTITTTIGLTFLLKKKIKNKRRRKKEKKIKEKKKENKRKKKKKLRSYEVNTIVIKTH